MLFRLHIKTIGCVAIKIEIKKKSQVYKQTPVVTSDEHKANVQGMKKPGRLRFKAITLP